MDFGGKEERERTERFFLFGCASFVVRVVVVGVVVDAVEMFLKFFFCELNVPFV